MHCPAVHINIYLINAFIVVYELDSTLSEHEPNSYLLQEIEELVWSKEIFLYLKFSKFSFFTDNVLEWAVLPKWRFPSYMDERDWKENRNIPENSVLFSALGNYLLLLYQVFSLTNIVVILMPTFILFSSSHSALPNNSSNWKLSCHYVNSLLCF